MFLLCKTISSIGECGRFKLVNQNEIAEIYIECVENAGQKFYRIVADRAGLNLRHLKIGNEQPDEYNKFYFDDYETLEEAEADLKKTCALLMREA